MDQAQPQQDDNAVQKDLEEARKEIEKLTDVAKRAMADLQNYRRRVEEEKASFTQFVTAGLILEILPIIDNFGRAFAHMPEDLKSNEWVTGVMNIEKQLVEVIKKAGVNEIASTVGQQFDPAKHEAVLTDKGAKDIVIEELEKGYMLGEKIIRPAKVKVGNGTEN